MAKKAQKLDNSTIPNYWSRNGQTTPPNETIGTFKAKCFMLTKRLPRKDYITL